MPRASPPNLQIGHDVRRASRTPLISPGRKLVEGFVLTRLSSPFYGEVDRRKAARRRGAAPAASCLRQAPPPPGAPRRPLRPAANAAAHFPMKWGRKRVWRFPRIYSGVWRRFRRRLSQAPAQGRGKWSERREWTKTAPDRQTPTSSLRPFSPPQPAPTHNNPPRKPALARLRKRCTLISKVLGGHHVERCRSCLSALCG